MLVADNDGRWGRAVVAISTAKDVVTAVTADAVAADSHGEMATDIWGNVSIVAVMADAWGSDPNVIAKTPARVTVDEALKTPDPAPDSSPDVAVKSLMFLENNYS